MEGRFAQCLSRLQDATEYKVLQVINISEGRRFPALIMDFPRAAVELLQETGG